MTSRKSILVVGGGGKAPPSDGAPLPEEIKKSVNTPENLRRALAAMIQEAGEQGFDVQMMQLAGPDSASAWLEDVSNALASKPWDGFIIGNGIRGTPSLTVVFEQLVKIGRENAPSARMGFNTHPMDIVATMQRMFDAE